MSTTAVRNTAFTTRVTKAPAVVKCRSCGAENSVSHAPAWMRLIEAMAPGRGHAEGEFKRMSDLARKIQRTPQQTHQMLEQAVEAGAVKRSKHLGITMYRRTWYGRQLLGRWKSVGWRG